MERRLNQKFETYITVFKNNIRDKINSLEFQEKEKINTIMEYVYDYQRLVFEKEDIRKRRRVKNTVPVDNRCNAKRANQEQCTRRRKDGSEFCGTHVKGTPHGLITTEETNTNIYHKLEVKAQDIGGIVYYIDGKYNVFNTEDILNNKENPEIIAKYTLRNNTYSIPEFGI